jgi:hypothetical protein
VPKWDENELRMERNRCKKTVDRFFLAWVLAGRKEMCDYIRRARCSHIIGRTIKTTIYARSNNLDWSIVDVYGR